MHFKKPSDQDLQARLSELQYDVTQHAATERPFHNEFWNNHDAGIYVDVVTEGEYIEAGTPIQVIEVEGTRIVVKKV